VNWKTVEGQLRGKLEEWRQLLGRHVPQARQVLKKLLSGPIVFCAAPAGRGEVLQLRASVNLGKLLAGIACANMMASPVFMSWNQIDGWLRQVEGLRRAA
jgi:hypothetical protein